MIFFQAIGNQDIAFLTAGERSTDNAAFFQLIHQFRRFIVSDSQTALQI